MEKQTFYEKLKQLKPIVKAYFDTKKIADTPERLYLLEKCGTSKPSFATDSIKSEEINSLKKTQKILTIVLGLAMVWGVVCAIIGIVNLSGMDIALGLGILIGAFFLYRSLNGKFKEKLCAAQEQQIRVDEYNKQIEKVKAEHRAAVESLEEKHKTMQARFNELELSSALNYIHDYRSFSEMLSYAKKHPNQTTASSYIKDVREQSKKAKTFLHTQPQVNEYSSEHLYKGTESYTEKNTYQESQTKEIFDDMVEKMIQDKKALEKCSHCINTNKCGYSVKQHSLTCSAFKPK